MYKLGWYILKDGKNQKNNIYINPLSASDALI